MHTAQVARPPNEPTGAPRARHVGLTATARLGGGKSVGGGGAVLVMDGIWPSLY
jgi:hypothetical protein